VTDNLAREIRSIADFSDSEIELFFSFVEEHGIKKGGHFLKAGQVSYYMGYILSGLTMLYQTYEGREIPFDFLAENEWVAYLKSFSRQIPSDLSIKALEDTVLLRLSLENMQRLFQEQPKFMLLKNHYTEASFIRYSQHNADLAILDAKSRYSKFIRERRTLANRIPQYYIAAYLGIKPQSLSRIRKG